MLRSVAVHRSTLAPLLLVLGLGACIALGLVFVATRPGGRTAAAGDGPIASTPTHPDGEVFTPPPTIVSTLRNVVAHWTATNYSDQAGGGPDPYIDKTTTSDIWAQTDVSGNVVKNHGVVTGPNGEFVQEVLQDTTHTTHFFGQAYASVLLKAPSGSANPCQSGAGGLNLSTSARQVLPPFADPKALPGESFRLIQSRAPAPSVPTTAAAAGVKPVQVYGPTTTVARYEKDLPAPTGSAAYTNSVEIQADGHIVLVQGRVTDAQGNETNVSRQTFGSVQLYNPASVAASAFTLSAAAQEACHA